MGDQQQLVTRQVGEIVPIAPVPVETMIMAGIEKGITPEGMKMLVDLRLQLEGIRAEHEFNAAMTAFQSECPPVTKNRDAKKGNGAVMYSYADLDHIKRTIQPTLAKNGLSVTDDATFTKDSVEAVATVFHVGGHRRSAKFSAPVSGTEMMSDMQKSASALSFARRYALVLALGLTTGEQDDDGQSAGIARVTEQQAADLEAKMTEVLRNPAKFLKWLGVDRVSDLAAVDYDKAIKELERLERAK